MRTGNERTRRCEKEMRTEEGRRKKTEGREERWRNVKRK